MSVPGQCQERDRSLASRVVAEASHLILVFRQPVMQPRTTREANVIRVLTVLLAVMVLTVIGAQNAVAQETPDEANPPVFQGSLPTNGGMVLIATPLETTPAALVRSLAEGGCEVEVLAITLGGSFHLYAPNAPAFANAGFLGRFEPGAFALVRCAPPEIIDDHLLWLVTKERALSADYVPESLTLLPAELVIPGGGPQYLTAEAAEAVARLLEAASAAGHEIAVRSAYRSDQEQVFTHDHWVRLLGAEEASRRSAEPGHSEHQLGTVADVTSASVGWDLEPEFGDTPEGRWLARNAWRFGFVESYPEGAEETTGYRYEPWHLRYIGETHADWLRQTGLTLTEYLTRIRAGLD